MKEIIRTEKAPLPIGPYSQAIWAGPYLFCSGQIPLDPHTGEVIKSDIKGETRLVLNNVRAVLEKAGVSAKDVVKTTIFITDMKYFAEVNSVYAEFFGENPPARSCVAVSELPKKVNVEIEVIAYKAK